MKKQYVKIGLIISIILGILLCVGCKNLGKTYWSYDCVWYSEKPYVYLIPGGSTAILKIDEQEYNCSTESEPDGTGINFYIIDENNNDIYLWKAESKIKNDKLYLTVVEDNISDYQGKTIELIQISYDEKTIEELVNKQK